MIENIFMQREMKGRKSYVDISDNSKEVVFFKEFLENII